MFVLVYQWVSSGNSGFLSQYKDFRWTIGFTISLCTFPTSWERVQTCETKRSWTGYMVKGQGQDDGFPFITVSHCSFLRYIDFPYVYL